MKFTLGKIEFSPPNPVCAESTIQVEENSVEYWKKRCRAAERRMDELERTIRELRGGSPLTREDCEKINNGVTGVGGAS
jgi:hypothetical protein